MCTEKKSRVFLLQIIQCKFDCLFNKMPIRLIFILSWKYDDLGNKSRNTYNIQHFERKEKATKAKHLGAKVMDNEEIESYNMMLDIAYDSSAAPYQYEDKGVNFPTLPMHGQLDSQHSPKLTHNFSSQC